LAATVIKIFRKTAGTPFLTTKKKKKIWEEMKIEPDDERIR
jgi:hypothetical protein